MARARHCPSALYRSARRFRLSCGEMARAASCEIPSLPLPACAWTVSFCALPTQVWGVCFDPKTDRFCSVSEDKTLRIFEPSQQPNPPKPAPAVAA
eukprot:scaffold5983_cov137-Isochrysis_galbana.AAC.3